jgi:hypothetical protein
MSTGRKGRCGAAELGREKGRGEKKESGEKRKERVEKKEKRKEKHGSKAPPLQKSERPG